MPTYLYLHREQTTDKVRKRFRNAYEVRQVEYELSRKTNHKGEIISDICGGRIKVVIDGFGDDALFHWLFRPDMEEDGEIVTLDTHEKGIEKFSFGRARATGYRLHFDANMKDAVIAILTIDAKEITTDNDLNYEQR